MKLGSQEHKELFCSSFMDSYLDYQPETLPWPDLDSTDLQKLQGIPFWQEALRTESKAGVMVSAYAEMVEDLMIKKAIALQGKEEARHARLIQHLIDRYDVKIEPPPIQIIPNHLETAFIDFGFAECLDSFFAFGMFGIARDAAYMPEAIFNIFDPLLHEEARHIVFFVNWVTYLQIQRGRGFEPLRAVHATWHYSRALQELIQAFGGIGEPQEKAFTATGASSFMDNLTPELFFSVCLRENAKRMGVFAPELLQPLLLPRLSQIAFNLLKLLPKLKGLTRG